MTQKELEVRLSKAKILRALTYPGLRRVARNGRLLDVKEGQMIIGPEVGGTSAYVVLEGTISVVMPWGPVLAMLGPGEVFGEMALLQASERSAYCKAHVDSMVFEIPFSSFHGDLMTNPVVRGGLEEMALARRAIQTALRTGRRRAGLAPEEEEEAGLQVVEDGATPGDADSGDEPNEPSVFVSS
ncbi:MAG TPA: cyclic nucleotide-binding domain-containing protein [Chloroflexota bacterium]|nr:cyclic nucleotide-binding domain-containing protein [Chloroflexota bacterium]